MKALEFTHQKFHASSWETKLKEFIESLDCSDNIIWYKKREHKKINEELSTLGYYVKYRYGVVENISFKLNETEGKADGWIFKNGAIETIQIAIAYYEKEEDIIDKRTMNGEDAATAGWVEERIRLLKDRIEKRIEKKSNMNYQNIDTLLIGVRDWFVRRINTDFQDHKVNLIKYIESILSSTDFKELALVDADLVGKGELLIVPNKRLKTDHTRQKAGGHGGLAWALCFRSTV